MIDFTSPLGQYAVERLSRDLVIWLTTVDRRNGDPHPSLVWFWWNGTEVLIPSRPAKPKLPNIAAHPRVALNFDSERAGDGVVVFAGTAEVQDSPMTGEEWAAFATKYADRFPLIGSTPEAFRAGFSELVRVVPDRLRGCV